jgi:anti-anti-sigma factor
MVAVQTRTRRATRLADARCRVADGGRDAGDARVTVTGRIDRTTVAAVRYRLLHAAKAQPSHLTVDLDDATLLDGAGVAALVELWQFTSEHAIGLSVRTPAASVRQVFELGAGGRVLALRS